MLAARKEKTMRTLLAAAAFAGLAACATTPPAEGPPPEEPDGPCKAEPAQRLIGSKATAEAGAELLRLTGARVIRWVPPRTAVTMDFRADRLTVSYDDDMTIIRISCT
jgi:hypothetical protein